jgi:gliding motility-associated-like protein
MISNLLQAQLQNNQWRFGFGASIDFNTTPPSFPSGAALPSILPPLITGTQIEGTASIADKNTGALLFYTDGVTVWNALNQPMPNGANLGGSDVLSSYMAAVIVPIPGTCNKYYVFCQDDFEEGTDGITYSVVDMSLDNGLGDIVPGQKTIPLYDNNETELLMAYPKSTGDGYWLISNGSDATNPTLAAFEVTSQGVSSTPVLSPVLRNGSGKLNYQGTKFVCPGQFDALIGNFLGFEIYDFNAATGQISSPVNIPFSIPGGNPFQSFEYTFIGNYLYASTAFSLYRFDLTSGNPATIAASATLMPFTDQTLHGTAQLGPDNNLYYVVGSNVFRIENPDNLIPGPISELPPILTPSFCLPQWIFLLPGNNPQGLISLTGDSCIQTDQIFTVSDTSSINSIQWNFDDPSSGVNNTSSLLSPSHTFSEAGQYTVSAIVNYSCGVDSIFKTLTITNCDSIIEDCRLYIPNAFTPNGDGNNDAFHPFTNCAFQNYEFLIFNRWGGVVFKTSNPSDKWDGKFKGVDCSSDVYVYLVTYKFPTQQTKNAYGSITLLR